MIAQCERAFTHSFASFPQNDKLWYRVTRQLAHQIPMNNAAARYFYSKHFCFGSNQKLLNVTAFYPPGSLADSSETPYMPYTC